MCLMLSKSSSLINMTNFKCVFCGDKMDIPKEVKKEVSPVTHVFWHTECVEDPRLPMTESQREFYRTTGQVF